MTDEMMLGLHILMRWVMGWTTYITIGFVLICLIYEFYVIIRKKIINS